MNYVSISSLKKSTIQKINNYLCSIGREPFSLEYIKAVSNPLLFEEIQNTQALYFRGFFIDLSHSEKPDEANMFALVLKSVVSGFYTDVLMLNPKLEPSSIRQTLL